MIYASVCDGIGAVHVAWKLLGWRCAWTSEIEAFPAAVVEHRHGLTNLGDMTQITEEMLHAVSTGPVELLVGGTPCQSFSVAGLRRGLDDPRGNLALRFVQLVGVLRPTWVVWENVPGVLSSAGGRDFGTFLGALGNLGYGFAYRVLDAQWFGVAQRRRRVFLVGHARDWRRAAAVLFERESMRGNPPSRGAPRKDTAGTLVARSARNGGASNAAVDAGQLIFGGNNTAGPIDVAPSCLSHGGPHGRQDFASEAFVVSDDPTHAICANEQKTYTNEGNVFQLRNVVGHPRALAFKRGQSEAAGGAFVTNDVAPTIQSQNNGSTAVPAVAFKPSHFTRGKDGAPSEVTPPLSADADKGDQDPVILAPAVAFTHSGYSNHPAWITGDRTDCRSSSGHSDGSHQGIGVITGDQVPFVKSKRAQSVTDDETWVEGTVAPTQNTFDQGETRATTVVATPPVSFRPTGGSHSVEATDDCSPSLKVGSGLGIPSPPGVMQGMAVRRLTPLECERLQGFPDFYTAIVFKGKPAADGPRYRALGNSMAVPVMAWIGQRIARLEALCPE